MSVRMKQARCLLETAVRVFQEVALSCRYHEHERHFDGFPLAVFACKPNDVRKNKQSG